MLFFRLLQIKDRHLCFSLINKTPLSESEEAAEEKKEEEKEEKQSAVTSLPQKSQPSEDESRFVTEAVLCIAKQDVSNGDWHLAKGIRLGHTLSLELDDGHLWRRNTSLESVLGDADFVHERRKHHQDPWVTKASHRLAGRVTAVLGKTFINEEMESEEDFADVGMFSFTFNYN